MKKQLLLLVSIIFLSLSAKAQDKGVISGSFQSESQYYMEDSLGQVEFSVPPEKLGTNNYLKLNYTINNIEIGIRYEAYLPPLQGFTPTNEASGIANRYATYRGELLEVTAGNFYEQFGSGLILRSYEERLLGIDNSLDGIRVKLKPIDGVSLKMLYGRQRNYFDISSGAIRAIDGEVALTELLNKDWNTRIQLGGSLVSKYELNTGGPDIPAYVDSFSARLGIEGSKFNGDIEYVGQDKNPSFTNGFSQKEGSALLTNLSYFQKGLGANLTFRRIENISNRAERNETSANNMWVNFVPTLTKQHGYLLANIYPYAAQFDGEVAVQLDLAYTLKKGSALGGKYGTKLNFNFAQSNGLKTDSLSVNDEGIYDTEFFAFGDEIYYRDINFQIKKKFSKKVRTSLTGYHLIYNQEVVEDGKIGDDVEAIIVVAEVQLKLPNRNSFRGEVQYLSSEQGSKDWAALLLEYNLGSYWSFYGLDQYNVGGEDQIHYYQMGLSHTKNSSRIALSYGRQRGGLMCAGGVCRFVPYSTGLSLSISTSF